MIASKPKSSPAESGGVGRYRVVRARPIRGSLSEIPFPALLHQVYGMRASGVLHLRTGKVHKQLDLREGRPIAIKSNLVRERLGEWLVGSGRITKAVAEESHRRRRREKGLQGEILVTMEVLSEEELAHALREHADAKLLQVFDWKNGSFALELGKELQRATPLDVHRSPAEIVFRGIRTRFSIDRIDTLLVELDDRTAVLEENPYYSFQAVSLSPAEELLLGEAAQGVSIRAALKGTSTVRRALYGLLATGLLRAERRAPPARAAAKPTAQPKRETTTRPARVEPAAAPVEEGSAARDHSHYAVDHAQRAHLTALIERLRNPNPFRKLAIEATASEAEIRRAYAELARETHPDRFAGATDAVKQLAEEAFREISRAYELISQPERLAAYRADPERDQKEAEELEEGYRALAAEREFQRGEGSLRARAWNRALAHFERAVELYPDEGEYHAYSGWAYYLAHGSDPARLKEAFARAKRGAKLARDRERPYLFLGRLSQAGDRLELAERFFTKALECKPDSIEAMRELRLLHMRRPKRGRLARLLRR